MSDLEDQRSCEGCGASYSVDKPWCPVCGAANPEYESVYDDQGQPTQPLSIPQQLLVVVGGVCVPFAALLLAMSLGYDVGHANRASVLLFAVPWVVLVFWILAKWQRHDIRKRRHERRARGE